jgi:hypothetical protein
MKHDSRCPEGVPVITRETSIYFIQCDGPFRPIKIGYGKDPALRLHNLQAGCPYQLRLLASTLVPDGEAVERCLHELFHASYLRGEWFAETPELLDLAKRVNAYHYEMIAAFLAETTMPPMPPELTMDYCDVEPLALTIPSDVTDHLMVTKKDREARQREMHEWRRVAPLETAKPPKEKKPGRGEFLWRGKIRKAGTAA